MDNHTNSKIIVWDLFGGGQNSVYNSLKENSIFEIHTFDITNPQHKNQYQVDLSKDDIINKLQKFPKPDIIVASPLCQSFSSILSMKNGGTCFWKKENDKLVERSVEEFEELKSGFTRNLKAEHQLFIKRLGEKCINNTFKIIDYFKPELYYIENPATSLMWFYIKNNLKRVGFYNKATYGLYGFLSPKNTIFFSNIQLKLKYGKCDKKYEIRIIDDKKFYVLIDNQKIKIPVTNSRSNFLKISAEIGNMNIKKMDNKVISKLSKSPKQTNKLDSQQISESSAASAIPHLLIKDIFKQFEDYLNDKKSI